MAVPTRKNLMKRQARNMKKPKSPEKKLEKPISEEEHQKRIDLLKSIGLKIL
jgi:hypothetical protein